MKLNSVTTPVINEVKSSQIAKKAQEVLDLIVENKCDANLSPKISSARVNLEMNAEHMNPEDYIMARSYISSLEMDELIASELNVFR
jgi:hypothetical protein